MTQPMTEAVATTEATDLGGPELGQKRPVQNGEEDEIAGSASNKKARSELELGRDLKRLAEIVLLLSAMGNMRGGKKPSGFEVELMKEARRKLVEMCEGLAPKEIVGREHIGVLIDDLGLNGKVEDRRLGFRVPPRLTIAEKLTQTKRKMEESKKLVRPSAAYPSHPLLTSLSASTESCGPNSAVCMYSSDRPSHLPVPVGGTSDSLQPNPVSVTNSTSVQIQLPAGEVRAPLVSSGFPINHQARDSASVLNRAERTQNGTYASQMQANSSANHPLVNAPAWSKHAQSSASAKSGSEHKFPSHTPASPQGTTDVSMSRLTSQAANDQSFKPFTTQTVTGSLPGSHQPLQGTNFVQAPSTPNNHHEISKIIQKLLQPQLPDHATWTPPSRDYMNKALTCQSCQITVNEVDTVLICDSCERGFHFKCVQSPNQRGILRGEWHCARCLAISNGKPLPPKYGRVMRSNPPLKVPNPAGVQPSSEQKVGTMDLKTSQQKITANGGSSLQSPAQTSRLVESVSNSRIPDAREMDPNSFSSNSKNVDDKLMSGTSLNTQTKSLAPASVSPSVSLSSERSAQPIKNSELPTHEESSSEPKPEPSSNSSDLLNDRSDVQQSDRPQIVDRTMVPNSPEVPSENCQDNHITVQRQVKLYLKGNSDTPSGHDIKQDDQDIAQENIGGSSESSSTNREHSGFPSDGLHAVEWVGSVTDFVNGKTFYQSCRVDGVTYELQDHALFHPGHGNLIPSKLQSMWEDSKTGSKWVIANRCYFPRDLPANIGRPSPPDCNEVYESNHSSSVMAGMIRGPCEVFPAPKFKEEGERRSQFHDSNNGLHPIFLCKWFYDESKGHFQPVCS